MRLALFLQLQGILGQQQYLSRQEQLAAAGLQAVSGGRQGGAYSAASAQPSLQHSSRSQLLQGFPSATSARDDARLADLLGGWAGVWVLAGCMGV